MMSGVDVLEAILNNGTASTSTTDVRREAQKVYQQRVEGKKVQLGNLDRSRPVPRQDSLAHRQIEKRTQRVLQRYKHSSRSIRGKGKGKEKGDLIPPTSKSKRLLKREEERPLSRRERSELGLDTVDERRAISYDSLLPVHKLWAGYIQRLLGFVDEHGKDQSNQLIANQQNQHGPVELSFNPSAVSGFQTSIVKADMCGSLMRVTRALNPSLVGIEGIVAKETASTFVIVTKPPSSATHGKGGRTSHKYIKVIPKENAVFLLRVPLPAGALPSSAVPNEPFELQVPIYGDQFGNNMQTRATKKYKARRTIDL